jgi:TrkA-C domain
VIAMISFLILILLMLIVNRVATIALIATGLPADVARFQARSALTGVGYTTAESESMVNHPARRRIIHLLMLIGNAGLVTIVVTLILTFATASGDAPAVIIRLAMVAGGLFLLLMAARSERVRNRVTPLIVRGLRRWTDLDVRDMVHLMQLTQDYAISEMFVESGGWVADRSLAQLDLPEEGVLVLAVQRADGRFEGAPRGETVVRSGDTVVLYGRSEILADLASRPADYRGDRAHLEAAEEYQALRQTEEEDDDAA